MLWEKKKTKTFEHSEEIRTWHFVVVFDSEQHNAQCYCGGV